MLTCKDVSDRASALIDGELGAWDRLQVWVHLAMCADCTRFVDQMRVTRKLTRAAANAPAPANPAEIEAILTRLHDETQPGD